MNQARAMPDYLPKPITPPPTAQEIRAAVETLGRTNLTNPSAFKWQAWIDTSRWALAEAQALDDKAAADRARVEAALKARIAAHEAKLATARAAAATRARFDSSIVDQIKAAELRSQVAKAAGDIWLSGGGSVEQAIVKALSNYELKKV